MQDDLSRNQDTSSPGRLIPGAKYVSPPTHESFRMNTFARTLAVAALALSVQACPRRPPNQPSRLRSPPSRALPATSPPPTAAVLQDWGPKDGPVVTFSHGWPLNSDSWESQMIFLANHGYRVIAHDRRGHGRSSQPWDGNDMDHYADDLATVINTLDLHDVTLVGFSTGGGEVARYIGRHGTGRVKKPC